MLTVIGATSTFSTRATTLQSPAAFCVNLITYVPSPRSSTVAALAAEDCENAFQLPHLAHVVDFNDLAEAVGIANSTKSLASYLQSIGLEHHEEQFYQEG